MLLSFHWMPWSRVWAICGGLFGRSLRELGCRGKVRFLEVERIERSHVGRRGH